MFSQTVEYALRAIVFLADQSPGAATTGQIAEATKVPSAYLSKVLQSLSRVDIVNSQRGVKGGMSLAKPPEELTLLDVVNAVDPIRRITECPLGIKTHGNTLCPLHRRLDDAFALVESAFGGTTLADLLTSPEGSYPLCEIPKPQVSEIIPQISNE